MMLPAFTTSWLHVIALYVDVATRPEMVDLDKVVDDTRGATTDAFMTTVVQRLGLSREEDLVAWCLIASQLDPQLATRLEALSSGAEVTLGALTAIVYRAHPARAIADLCARGRLFRFGLVESADDPRLATPSWARRTVRASDRLLALSMMSSSDATLDPDLERVATIDSITPAIDQLAIRSEAIADVRQAFKAGSATLIVSGAPGLGRRTLLAAAACEAGIDLLQIDGRKLAKDDLALRRQLRAIARECTLLARTPLLAYLDAVDVSAVGEELVTQITGLVLATTGPQPPAIRWDRPTIRIELNPPTSAQRATLWHAELGCGTDADAQIAADLYPLAPALVHAAARASRTRSAGRELKAADITAGVRTVLDDKLGQLARRVDVTQSWDDLVLPPDQLDSITELLARIRQRRRVYEDWGFAAKVGKGLGVTALFSGPPGTGKTMVAALVARDLGLELYQVDLAKIVSKWVGETEKHLGELFDAAEAGYAVLLFDEADSLFGKRTDVKSSNDRYANLEVNYLLQRLETYTGICLLTSNHSTNMDPAFQRRLSLHLRFELPDAHERARLWRAVLPAKAPLGDDVDLVSLAKRYAMGGGNIRNAALRAAFLAAEEGGAITTNHLHYAARVELEATGKIAA